MMIGAIDFVNYDFDRHSSLHTPAIRINMLNQEIAEHKNTSSSDVHKYTNTIHKC